MEKEKYQRMFSLEENYWWFRAKRKFIDFFIKKFISKHSNLNKFIMLDVGCGSGIMLNNLNKYGTAIGVDNSYEGIKFCQIRGHKLVVVGDALNLPFKDNSFDIITCLDVMEHLEDDSTLLAEIYRICKKMGMVIITAPAYKFLWGYHDEIHHHKRRYTKRMLREKICNTNFNIYKITYINTILFPMVLIFRIIKRYIIKESQADDFISVPSILNKILFFIFSGEIYLINKINLPYGVSLFCILTRSDEK